MKNNIKLPSKKLSPAETVIASGYAGEYEEQVYLVLRDEPAYYEVVVYKHGERDKVLGTFRNIVPAVDEYNRYGGFY